MEYRKTILILDDMKQIRDILWFSLKKEGYRPVLAENGTQGIKALHSGEYPINLVLLDVMMPKLDGFKVLERIRTSGRLTSKIPVIMLTAKAQRDDVIKGLEKGADDYVVKPYKFPELLAKIRNLIG